MYFIILKIEFNTDGYHSPNHNGDSTSRNITHSASVFIINNPGSVNGGLNKSNSNFTLSDETQIEFKNRIDRFKLGKQRIMREVKRKMELEQNKFEMLNKFILKQ